MVLAGFGSIRMHQNIQCGAGAWVVRGPRHFHSGNEITCPTHPLREAGPVDDLRQARMQLLQSVQDLSDEELRIRNADGWSILHVLEHLHLTEKAVVQGIRHALTKPSSEIPRQSVESVLDRSRKLKSPKVSDPQGMFTTLDEAVASLAASRSELTAVLASIEDADALHHHGFRHPFFGMLSIHQWLEVLPLHERRHTAQIEEMKQVIGSNFRMT